MTEKDQGDDGNETTMVMHDIAIIGEVVLLLDKYDTKAGEFILLKQFDSKL